MIGLVVAIALLLCILALSGVIQSQRREIKRLKETPLDRAPSTRRY